jgi:tetratricopeptide (TPR) repeat protein
MRARLIVPSRLLAGMLLFSVPTDAMAVPLGTTAPLQSPFQNAFDLVAQGKLDPAEKAFLAFKAKDPKASDPYLGLSYIAIQRHDLPTALKHLNEGIAAAPTISRLYLTRGRVEVLQGKPEMAAADFEKAVALDGTNIEPLLALGDLYLGNKNEPQKALGYYSRVTAMDTNSAAGYFGAGMSLASAAQYQPAIAAFKKAETIAPGNPASAIEVARIYAKQNRLADADGLLNLVIKRFPKSYDAFLLKGAVCKSLGRPGDAIAAFVAALAIQPNSLQALVELGNSARIAGKPDLADGAYKRALSLAPQSPLILNGYAWMLANVPIRLDQALSMARKAVEIAPQESAFHDTLGYVLMKRGDANGAKTEFLKAIALDPKSDAKAHLAGLQEAKK